MIGEDDGNCEKAERLEFLLLLDIELTSHGKCNPQGVPPLQAWVESLDLIPFGFEIREIENPDHFAMTECPACQAFLF